METHVKELGKGRVLASLPVDPPLGDGVVGGVRPVSVSPLQQRIEDEIVDRVDDRVLVALSSSQSSKKLSMDVQQVGV